MIKRQIHDDIVQYMSNFPGCPVLITGLTQCGKTTLASSIGKSFNQFIFIDLSTDPDQELFMQADSPEMILKSLFFIHTSNFSDRNTLILLREIQFCPEAIDWLIHYLKNVFPFQIIATASFITPEITHLLESLAAKLKVIEMLPLCFSEFLQVSKDQSLISSFSEVPVPYFAYQKLLQAFHLYSLIGGMPKVVSAYLEHGDLSKLSTIYDEILFKINDYIEYGSRSNKSALLYQDTLLNAFPFAATRIFFKNFGNIPAGSREIAGAFTIMEKAFVSWLIWPITDTKPGTEPVKSKSPRLQMVDTGLVNYFSGIQDPLFRSEDMNAIFEGQIAKQVIGQELAFHFGISSLKYWVREKLQSTAEVDFLIPYQDLLIPVTVKSGEPGRLRGLHQFIDSAPHPFAVRLSAGIISVGQYQTISGKKYYLLNLPYFLASKIPEHLKGFIRLVLE
jgi:predicted AAA+ superfamily ATPase